mmetsp:Transcript_97180/g.190856  ORF Transcript_97180/g.190856 Transcript_97180/m.190856 type:complete len:1040 (+) Transcript_97180:130-3249(+)
MPLRLQIKKELSARSDRVKSVDIFPAEHPWVLSALYSGNVYIWDYSANTLVKSFEMGTNPVRCARFIVRKNWIIAGTDDMKLRVYNYNTMEKVKEWEAHTDYIRFIEIHPNRPYVLSSSDDMSIKLWDWDRDFECVQVFEGHGHYVMMVKINPRDTNTFASASLDKTIKVWGLTASTPHFSLDGPGAHEKGVNCLDYYPGGDKPYLLSGADDRTVKIWDYQTKACLQTLEGHSHNVSSVCFHPRLPMIISASEDGTVRLWHSTTYRPETTLNYGMERAWCIAATKDANKIAIGYDEGTVVLKLGNEKPVASLDTNTGKLVWAISHDIQTMSVKGLSKETEIVDGERVQLNARDLGACEVYPQSVQHNSNGSFIVVCGDGEYIIYTSQALRNKAFGSALEFVWSSNGTGDYAIRESTSRVRNFKNFKDHKQISLPVASADGIFGGVCLAVKGPDCVVFFDWEDGTFIRKIDVSPTSIYWNEAGDSLVLVCSDCFYTLRYDRDVVAAALASGNINPEEGVDGSFELMSTTNERAHTGQWVGECFLYTNSAGKMNYLVGGEVMTLCHLDHPMYLLGYVPKEDRAFLVDKTYNVFSYKLLLSMLSYQSAVVRKDFVTANSLLPLIPKSEYGAVARFLESQGFKEEALAVSTDPDHKFELAVDLRHMSIAHAVLAEQDAKEGKLDLESTEMQSKWRRLGDLALSNGELVLAEQCAKRSADLSGLLLLYSSSGNKAGMVELGAQAKAAGRFNVAFLAYFLTGQVEAAIELLIEANRIPEAAFMARTYMPSQISRVLEIWKTDLKTINEKAADALADPAQYPNLFPDLEWALKVEQMFLSGRDSFVPASSYLTAKDDLNLDLIGMVKAQAEAMEAAEVEQANERDETEAIAMSLQASSLEESSSPPRSPAKQSQQVDEVEVEEQTPSPAPASPKAPSAPASPTPSPTPSPAKSPVAPAPAVVEVEQHTEEEVVAEEEEDEDHIDLDDLGEDEEEEDGEEVNLDDVSEEEKEIVKTPTSAPAPSDAVADAGDSQDILDEDFDEGEDW